MKKWLACVPVIASVALSALLFGPVIGFATLLPPVLAVAVCLLVTDLLFAWLPRAAAVRPAVACLLSVVALAEAAAWATTRQGLPTAATAEVLLQAAKDGWLTTLQTTWPVGPLPEVFLFVPLLAILAGVVGIEVIRRTEAGLVAMVPAFGLAVLSQAYQPVGGLTAACVALGFAVLAALCVMLRRERIAPAQGRPRPAAWFSVATLVPFALAAAPVALLAGTVGVLGRPAATLATDVSAQPAPKHVASPIDEIAARLSHPEQIAFTVRTDGKVDRWMLVVFDGFDGAQWKTSSRYQLLGSRLEPDPAVTVPTQLRTARISVTDVPAPWLPTHGRTVAVADASVMADPAAGSIVATQLPADRGYTVTWAAPQLDRNSLTGAQLDFAHAAPMELGAVPPELFSFAESAVDGQGASFRTALQLEKFLRDRYVLATESPLPTGHSYAQLQHFLNVSKRGTSEQFACAYVVLARMMGIPARLVVGFRQPEPSTLSISDRPITVRNKDILAWPEVAVAGIGWVPLDPSGTAPDRKQDNDPIADATEKARDEIDPQIGPIGPPKVVPPSPGPAKRDNEDGGGAAGKWLAGAVLLVILLRFFGVPLAKWVRRRLRHRYAHGGRGVATAWLEARDLLCDYGMRPKPTMTVRAFAFAVAAGYGDEVGDGMAVLAKYVDFARWSGQPVPAHMALSAWRSAAHVRVVLGRRSRWRRLRAMLSLASLLPYPKSQRATPRIPLGSL